MEITGDQLQEVIAGAGKATQEIKSFLAIKPQTQEVDSRAATHQERPPSPQVVAAELEGIQWGDVTAEERDIISGPEAKGTSLQNGETWYVTPYRDGATLFSKRDPEHPGWTNALVVPEKNLGGLMKNTPSLILQDLPFQQAGERASMFGLSLIESSKTLLISEV